MTEFNGNGNGKGLKLNLQVTLGQIMVLIGLIGTVVSVMNYIGKIETGISVNSARIDTLKDSVQELRRNEQRLESRIDYRGYNPGSNPAPWQP